MNTPLPQGLFRRLGSLGTAQRLLVCCDYDGTLAPLARRPEEARLLPGAFDLLHDLARLPDTRVVIVSGRSRDNLRAHSGLDLPVLLVGSHGAELPGRLTGDTDAQCQASLDALESALAQICARSPGAWIERKPFGMAAHIREVSPPDAERVAAQVHLALLEWPAVHVIPGKAVIELSLSHAGKGDAVRWLRDNWGDHPQVLYLGDDVTDEAAFGALGPSDFGVKVGAGPSRAEYRVASEREALRVLNFVWRHRTSMVGDRVAQERPRGPEA